MRGPTTWGAAWLYRHRFSRTFAIVFLRQSTCTQHLVCVLPATYKTFGEGAESSHRDDVAGRSERGSCNPNLKRDSAGGLGTFGTLLNNCRHWAGSFWVFPNGLFRPRVVSGCSSFSPVPANVSQAGWRRVFDPYVRVANRSASSAFEGGPKRAGWFACAVVRVGGPFARKGIICLWRVLPSPCGSAQEE